MKHRKQRGRVLSTHEKNLKRDLQHDENAFENIEQRRRFTALGQKTQKVSLSTARTKQIENRKETLLRDFYNSARVNTVIDERDDENYNLDTNVHAVEDKEGNAVEYVVQKLVPDEGGKDVQRMRRAREKALRRQNGVLAAERKKRKRGALFELGDDATDGLFEETEQRGRSTAVFGDREEQVERELFDGVDAPVDHDLGDEEQQDLDEWMEHTAQRMQKQQKRRKREMQDAEEQAQQVSKRKTRKERLEDIIDKSKEMREAKMELKDQMELELEELNDDYEEVMQYLASNDDEKSKKSGSVKETHETQSSSSRDDVDEFDRMVRELAEDKPTAVLHPKSIEKMEQRERERLLKLEIQRQSKMQKADESDDSDDDNDDGDDEDNDNSRKNSTTFVDSADSMDDGLDITFGGNDSDNEDISSDEDTRELDANRKIQSSSQEEVSDINDDIPYVIRVPNNYEELQELFEERTPEEVRLICNRIVTVNSNDKLRTFLQLLLEHFNRIGVSGLGDGSTFMAILDVLSEQIQGLSLKLQSHAARIFERVILFMQHSLSVHIAEVARPQADSTAHGYPGTEFIFFLQLIGNMFPRSDHKHPLIASALLLLNEIISHCPLRTMRDVLYGITICSIIFSYTKESKRISPEAIHFLTSIFATAIPDTLRTQALKMVTTPSRAHGSNRNDWLQLTKKGQHISKQQIDLVRHVVMGYTDEKLHNAALCAVVDLLGKYTTLYASAGANTIPSVPEMLKDALSISEHLHTHLDDSASSKGSIADGVKGLMDTLDMALRRISMQRIPLQVKTAKRAQLFEFEPLIYNENGYRGPIVDLDKHRLQRKVIQKKIKREKRSAVRELRKDNAFMRTAREKVVARESLVRKEKYKRAVNTLQEERNMQVQLDAKIHKVDRMRKKMRKERKQGQ